MSVDCRACAAELPLVWCVQSRKMMHLRGLDTLSCTRIEERDRRARESANAIANDRGNANFWGR